MDVINKEFQTCNRPVLQPKHNQIREKGKKRLFYYRVYLRGGLERSGDKEKEWIVVEQKDKRRKDRQGVRCGLSNHKIEACLNQWRKTPPFLKPNMSIQLPTKKTCTDLEKFCITEMGSEEDEQSGKE